MAGEGRAAPSAIDALRSVAAANAAVDAARTADGVAVALAASLRSLLHFGAVAVHLVDQGGQLVVAAADGPADLVAARGQVVERAAVDAMLARGEVWGSLRFASSPLRRSPPVARAAAEEAWQPGDVLLAPMRSSGGTLLGVVCVDRPADGLLPGAECRLVLELAVAHGAVALARRASAPELSGEVAAYREAFEASPVAVALLDASLTIVAANDALARSLGAERTELAGVDFADVVADEDAYDVLEACRSAVERPGARTVVEHRFASRDGLQRWARSSAHAVRPPGGGPAPVRLVVSSVDVTEERRARPETGARGSRDTLTGLGNRRAALARVERALAQRRDGESVALVVVDVDDLAQVNDTHGRNAGDAVLVRTAGLLSSMLRSGEDLYRFGGDELAVVCEHLRGRRAAEALAERLAAVRPTATGRRGEFSCALRAAVAVAEGGPGTSSAASLVAEAFDALETARRSPGRRGADSARPRFGPSRP